MYKWFVEFKRYLHGIGDAGTRLFIFTFDVNLHRPKKARGNEKDKLPSGVERRSNNQQTSTLDTGMRGRTFVW